MLADAVVGPAHMRNIVRANLWHVATNAIQITCIVVVRVLRLHVAGETFAAVKGYALYGKWEAMRIVAIHARHFSARRPLAFA